MELVNIAECEVTITLTSDTCRELTVALKEALKHDPTDLTLGPMAAFFEAAAMAASVFSEMGEDYRARYGFASGSGMVHGEEGRWYG